MGLKRKQYYLQYPQSSNGNAYWHYPNELILPHTVNKQTDKSDMGNARSYNKLGISHLPMLHLVSDLNRKVAIRNCISKRQV